MSSPPKSRSVFFLSDGTGITAETLGRSLMTQFSDIRFKSTSWPFLDNLEKARFAVARINRAAEQDGAPPLLFSTLVDPEVRTLIGTSHGMLFDFFATFRERLESVLDTPASPVMGRTHGMGNHAAYHARIDALNFALSNDDGGTTSNYHAADIILIGVSRSGKTPACLYLALRHGILAANYPLTEEDLDTSRLPAPLEPFRQRLFGLTIDPDRLHQLRQERLPDSRYAAPAQCRQEAHSAQHLFQRNGVQFLDTTYMSVEEIATTLIHQAGLERRMTD